MIEKKVILCEGNHDVIFFSILLEHRRIKYDKIDQRELSNPRQRAPETSKIREFLGTRGKSYKFLIKDEHGWSNCVKNFIILYEDEDVRYRIYLILDADSPALDRLKEDTTKRFGGDILNKKTENYYLTKDKINHRIFFVPESLESQVYTITRKKIDGRNHDEIKIILEEFRTQCLKLKINWFLELENIIFTAEQ